MIIAPQKEKSKKKKQHIEVDSEDQHQTQTLKDAIQKRAIKPINLDGLTPKQKQRELERIKDEQAA